MLRKFRYILEYAVLRFISLTALIVPPPLLLWFGRGAGFLWYHLDGRRREIAFTNMKNSFGEELTFSQIKKSVAKTFTRFGESLLMVLTFPKIRPSNWSKVVEIEGLDIIRKAYDSGKGVLLFSGHFGCWELIPHVQGYMGLPLSLVVRKLDNPYLEKLFLKFRGLSGNSVIYKRNAIREILKTLGKGKGVAIVIDQDARGESAIFVDFFGRPAATIPTLAITALRTKAFIIPVFNVPLKGWRYRITYGEPVVYEPTGNREKDIAELTARCTSIIEREIRKFPSLWLWMHNRWKRRPVERDTNKSPGADRSAIIGE